MISKKQIPNVITIGRGAMALAIAGLFMSNLENRFLIIFILFLLASISDWLDGYLSRKWKVVSDFGKVFDPIFDKILTLIFYFFLFSVAGMPKLIFLLLFLREIFIDGLKNYMLAKGIVTPAIKSAKFKTFFQIAMIFFALLFLIYPRFYWFQYLAYILGIIAVFLAYYSGWIYIKKWANQRND
ncbi:MAG: CDP-diacylglycerol--glycerol-3-phosphate 3-phosphatidyltransferase [Parcubacteria group bacterium]|jgi:CDP-diacylglycerol--glycerol-3-phosphate 3-phosphatidyltransferase